MKVILLKDVKGIGRRFEEKEVSDGHAINFLIPRKLAVSSTSGAEVKALKEREEKSKEKSELALLASIQEISGTTISIKENANEKGHLFSGLSSEKLSAILKREKGMEIDAKHFVLRAPIKEVGTHEVPVRVGGKETHFTLTVEAK